MDTYNVVKRYKVNETLVSENVLVDLPLDEAIRLKERYNQTNQDSAVNFLVELCKNDKHELARKILDSWYVSTDETTPKSEINRLMANAGFLYSSNYGHWYPFGAKHELFKLHWELSIDGQLEIEQGDEVTIIRQFGRNSAQWLEDHGFNSSRIFKAWRIAEIGEYDT